MTYDGHVSPGGPAATRELGGLTVTKLSVGPMDNNVYVLRDKATGEQLLIDAAAEPERILELIGTPETGGGISTVVTTHRHKDHWGALAAVVEATGAFTVTSGPDAKLIEVPTERWVKDGDIVFVGTSELEVITLHGHTEESVALLYEDTTAAEGEIRYHLFTGDALFPGGIGNTFGDAAAFKQLFNDVGNKVFGRLPDKTWFYPGHGDDSTLGAERPHLAEWAQRGW